MSLGSIFVGLAIAVITIAYIVRPFRTAPSAADSRTDRLIEAWIRAAPAAHPGTENAVTAPGAGAPADATVPVVTPTPAPVAAPGTLPAAAVNFCPQCGRRVTAAYRFCPGCGARLPHEESAAAAGAPSDGAA